MVLLSDLLDGLINVYFKNKNVFNNTGKLQKFELRQFVNDLTAQHKDCAMESLFNFRHNEIMSGNIYNNR